MLSTSLAVTRGVRVEVRSAYVPEQSDPENGEFFFAYTVRITNEGRETVQLLSRHWIITDADGRTQEVRGPGVVGEQPVLEPGESFEYTSACPLETACGSMHGSYRMSTRSGAFFDAEIAPFGLSRPFTVH